LVVADKWVGRQVSVICSASNEVDSVPQTASNSISFNVTEARKTVDTSTSVATGDVSMAVIVAVVLITSVVLLAVAVALLVIRRRRKHNRLPPKGAKPLPTKEELMRDHSGTGQGTAAL
jgi:hypothetical protein